MSTAPFYGVTTTGVYCRTGCASRRPLARNVRFFKDAKAARDAGFRACKRCRPDDVAAVDARIVQACRVLDDAAERLTLSELAQRVGLSAGYLQRLFTRTIGVSPRAYAKLAREERFERPRGGGKGKHVTYAIVDSALGRVLVAATSRGICRVDIGERDAALERQLRETFPAAQLARSEDGLESATSRIVAYLANKGPWPLLPIDLRATAFQMRVWGALRAIKPGKTMGYAELARAIGSPSAARAVARACASNPVALLIPCHRIVPSSGGIGGYRWGTRRKARLLEIECAS
ncbi:MAG TPA: methylated-DNA--[protein]-cysteine S-methyltransferase [Alphaproteobacteria bacterium]|nr:methylated-DNA--[protein]-cysteine S-methyltransferase [Alphaproteobacteria bacterium]